MSLDADDEILQDFLVEAGEILERLNEELLDLEQRPDDIDLLNAVFRGFHTIKGGAGFLALTGLVDVCHRAEDVFNILRNGERSVDTDLMDVVLQVLDVVNSMFAEVQAGEMPTPADNSLLEQLEMFAAPAGAEQDAEQLSATDSQTVTDDVTERDQTDIDFDAMLDSAQAQGDGQKGLAGPEAVPAVQNSDDITDDEFDALLDELHGAGKGPTVVSKSENAEPPPAAGKQAGDEITEDEFEALLDELHGKGKAPVVVTQQTVDKTKPSQDRSKPPVNAAPAGKKSEKPKQQKKPVAQTSQPEATVRVDTNRLDAIMNMVGELVLVRNRMTTLKDELRDESMDKAVSNLDVVTSDLQTAVMKTRMQPVKKVFGRFPRVVRDLARNMKKEINLVMEGEETDLDKNLVEALADPLVHLVRNAVDHGIEMPDEREAIGKPRSGTVTLSATQEGDHILLAIQDDGRGMDPEVLREKAVSKGLMDTDAAARLDDRECFNLIFHAGFSTREEISDVSGRGVGMDVVKTKISQLNGNVEIDSELGRGSRLMIRVPLTLAIMPTLMVELGRQPFALPLGSVSEIFDLDRDKTNVVDGQKVIMVRNETLPIYYLREWLIQADAPAQRLAEHVVVVRIGSQSIGFVVEQLIGQEEVVIKPLGAFLQGTPGFAGATITGDGRIALIIDVPGLMKARAQRF